MKRSPDLSGNPPDDAKVQRRQAFSFATIEQIMGWCCVSRATAYRYKSGTAEPTAQALALFKLYDQGKVLGEDWEGFRVRGSKIIDPLGKSLTPTQLEAYQLVVQALHETSAANPIAELAMRGLARAFRHAR